MTLASTRPRLMQSAKIRRCTTPFLPSVGKEQSNCAGLKTATTVSWTTLPGKNTGQCRDIAHIYRLNSAGICFWKCAHNELGRSGNVDIGCYQNIGEVQGETGRESPRI